MRESREAEMYERRRLELLRESGRHIVTVVERHDQPKVWTERAECSCGWVGPNRRRHSDRAAADGAAHADA